MSLRIAGVVSLVVVVLMTFSLLASYFIIESRIENSGRAALYGYSRSLGANLSNHLSNVDKIGKQMRDLPNVSPSKLSLTTGEYAETFGFREVSLVSEKGTIYGKNTNIADQPRFKRAMNGETFITSPMKDAETGEMVFYVSSRVSIKNGFQGVLLCTLPASDLYDVVASTKLGENGFGYIIDNNGTIIAHDDPLLCRGDVNYITMAVSDPAYQAQADAVETMLRERSGTLTLKDDSVNLTIGYQEIEGTDGWIFCVAADRQEFYASFRIILMINVLAFFVFQFGAFFYMMRRWKPVSKAFKEIAGDFNDLSDGNLQIEVQAYEGAILEVRNIKTSLGSTIYSLNEYVKEISDSLDSLANNDYSIDITSNYAGEFNKIKTSLLQIIYALNEIISKIGEISSELLGASGQVSATAQTLAQGATEQASAVEELVSTISGLSEQVEDTAQRAGVADLSAKRVYTELTESNASMEELTKAVEDISDTSDQIAKIVSMIENIAFQTNMLALNAAVEAASAGVNGKSFAVVADEVKSLANKCAKAAENTSNMIKNTISAVDRGMRLSSDTAQLMSGVVGSVDEVVDIITNISSDSAAESEALKQAVLGLDQVSSVVQSNSSMAEESAAVSQELAGYAQDLQTLVSQFKLREN